MAATAVTQYQDRLEKLLRQPGAINDLMATAEKKTGVQRIYLAYGALGLTMLWLAFGFGAQLLANFIGFAYPAYCSMKALESKNVKDDTQWLTYWVVFALFSILEFFADILVGWVPFYWLTKCIFMVWCMAPIEANGSFIIYSRIIRPVFLKHETKLDNMVNKATSKAGDLFGQISDAAKDISADHIKAN
ncbi:receptor expression-enhancing protein 5 [Eurytemora carolleeae]|uniref:receptor expression-enhancing protein 5 n=1 Tax=Eurytemora carolleeae TaxID=1294199 RepID=UPI000C780348|nr:receptor expression-enhancing protein 5 [Eurytemora carolleeae]|eukprot:XP_023347124.1 receptor expression-enhancing protein 5-like [Eurytemora affinis]